MPLEGALPTGLVEGGAALPTECLLWVEGGAGLLVKHGASRPRLVVKGGTALQVQGGAERLGEAWGLAKGGPGGEGVLREGTKLGAVAGSVRVVAAS